MPSKGMVSHEGVRGADGCSNVVDASSLIARTRKTLKSHPGLTLKSHPGFKPKGNCPPTNSQPKPDVRVPVPSKASGLHQDHPFTPDVMGG